MKESIENSISFWVDWVVLCGWIIFLISIRFFPGKYPPDQINEITIVLVGIILVWLGMIISTIIKIFSPEENDS